MWSRTARAGPRAFYLSLHCIGTLGAASTPYTHPCFTHLQQAIDAEVDTRKEKKTVGLAASA